MLLHSCDRARLSRGDLFAPLVDAKRAGKVRAIGYSGDGDALDFAIDCGVFDVVECSVNVVDQAALASAIPRAVERGIGVIAKRPLARGDVAEYRDRVSRMFSRGIEIDPSTAIRFAAVARGVDCALVGTARVDHLVAAAKSVALGPLSDAHAMRDRFDDVGRDWHGVI
jgi:aryl-alcohol dehydrogenase-like predicted oxidoreductase